MKCGRQLYVMSFGYGGIICPGCYNGEKPFIFLDKSYWLNRILARFFEQMETQQENDPIEQLLLDHASFQSEIEVMG